MQDWVTCYTDASWDPHTNKGGWAYMIRSDAGWFKKNGPPPVWATCSATAEMAAVIAGVYRALRVWPGTKGVGVRTDCDAAIHYLQYRPYEMDYRRKDWLPIREMLHKVLAEYDCKIKFVHVKGHQPRWRSNQAKLNGNVDYWANKAREGEFINQSSEDPPKRRVFVPPPTEDYEDDYKYEMDLIGPEFDGGFF